VSDAARQSDLPKTWEGNCLFGGSDSGTLFRICVQFEESVKNL
jgi:hypothetical protein